MRLLLFSFTLLFTLPSMAQKKVNTFDTTHSPKKAVILSAVVPGAGQVYNRKWWKVPIIYAGLGTSVYFLIRNNQQYNLYRNEYLYRLNNSTPNTGSDLINYSDANLLTIIDQYQKWRDLSVIAIAGVYALQLVDAAVDGYLFRLDTSNDLSFRFRPSLIQTPYSLHPALRVRIKF